MTGFGQRYTGGVESLDGIGQPHFVVGAPGVVDDTAGEVDRFTGNVVGAGRIRNAALHDADGGLDNGKRRRRENPAGRESGQKQGAHGRHLGIILAPVALTYSEEGA